MVSRKLKTPGERGKTAQGNSSGILSGGKKISTLGRLKTIPGPNHMRVHPRAKVHYRVCFESMDQFAAEFTQNISVGGVFVRTFKIPQKGDLISIALRVPHLDRNISATVKVTRLVTSEQSEETGHPAGFGATFVDLSARDTQLLAGLVDDHQQLQSIIGARQQPQVEPQVSHFGKYRIDGRLGEGGMAEVLLATPLEGAFCGRKVALKRLLSHLVPDAAYMDLFLSEADITRTLVHPTIVEIYETGEVEDIYYIAMEYIDGPDLYQINNRCIERKILLPIDFACYVVHTLAEALEYAHTAVSANGTPMGIVHCDVTPSNIFISRLGEIRLGDFGIAHTALPNEVHQRGICGKAHYLAPEQISGKTVTPATDVFALGIVLYELLTNRRPFDADQVEDLYQLILHGAVVPPSEYRPEIPPELEQTVLQALGSHLDPASGKPSLLRKLFKKTNSKPVRFSSAGQMAANLDKCYDHKIGNPLAIAAVVNGLFKK